VLRSLRVRLLLVAMLAIFVALAASWLAMTFLFERHIVRRVEADLTRDGMQLAANVSVAVNGDPVVSDPPGDARFQEPASGLYWQASTPQGTLRSRSLWDQSLPASSIAGTRNWTTRLTAGPHEKELVLVERVVLPDRRGQGVLLQLGHENKSLREAREEFGDELAVFLGLLWLILSAAAWVQVELGLRPLRGVRREVERLKRNPQERLHGEYAQEIEPLTRGINELADARERDLQRARRRAADLAHGLKTPLAALSAQSRRAREAGAHAAAVGLDHAIAAATAAVEGELARSRAATARAASATSAASPLPLIEAVVGVVERTEFGESLVFEVDVPVAMTVPLAASDFMELMGALIENAARYARRRVRIGGSSAAGGVQINVEDDGPGIGSERTAEAIMRGGRLDESSAGDGLGLAIAFDLVEATGGQIELLRSELAGLLIAISWPNSTEDAAQ
jgi:signal transduction histidine kinase